MKTHYDFKEIEKKWAENWKNEDLYRAIDNDSREKKYILNEFPYPSGEGLHVGHAFSFTGGDVFARYLRMKGYNVLFPMGWDAFGLPAENYAIKMKRKPKEVVAENVAVFKEQMNRLGLSIDWEREVNTTDPEYYKWTQWIFIKLFEKGLAYKQEMPINWCPSCKIGLANEEVVNGNCERCGAQTSRRNMSQWIVKITQYADRLIDGLKDTSFIDKVKAAQINWIDRKEWIDITYEVEGTNESVVVATTRPDTNFGATFVVLAPEHQLVSKLVSGEIKTDQDIGKISEYVRNAKNKSELDRQKEVVGRDKTGVFTGLYATNPLNGKNIPIWITDFVLGTVGTGAVVGVPAHDVRDFEFATQFGLDIVRVIVGEDGDESEIKDRGKVITGEGVAINSDFLNGLQTKEAIEKIMDHLEEKGWGKKTVRYHLRDWIFSRQHYWGEPVPMINCEKCGWVPVDEKDLPITLPEVEYYEPTNTGEGPLAKITEWVNTTCPKCGGPGKRETDTMPNWAGSDWYFIRYLDPYNKEKMADMSKMKYWLPVDVYIGGDEHNTLHLLYSRFIYQFLYDLGEVPTSEPYDVRVSHGVILGADNQRMSKSKGNSVIPDDVIEKVGADAVRLYLMFIGPFDGTMAWNDNALNGAKRFIDRVYKYISQNFNSFGETNGEEIERAINKTIKYATEGMEKFSYNTVVAKYMEFTNLIEKVKPVEISKSTINDFIKLLSPFVPFVSEELWSMMGNSGSVHMQKCPEYNESLTVEHLVEVPVQINGKLRGKVKISVQLSQEEVETIVLADLSLKQHFDGKSIKKLVYVPGRIINVVV